MISDQNGSVRVLHYMVSGTVRNTNTLIGAQCSFIRYRLSLISLVVDRDQQFMIIWVNVNSIQEYFNQSVCVSRILWIAS